MMGMKDEGMDGTEIADPVHEALDGSFEAAGLGAEEAARYRRLAAMLEEAVPPLRSVRAPDLTARVMAAIPSESPVAPEPPTSLFHWLWTPRWISFQLRPLVVLAAAAILVAVAIGVPRPVIAPLGDASTNSDAVLYVQFRLDAPGASRVDVAGTFTEWQPEIELTESSPGVWSALVPLEPGVHDYTFLIDGDRWVADPEAPQVEDGFGGVNSRLFLTRPGSDA
jgi:hypothetical protein